MNNTVKQLSQQERLETAFREGEFEFAEPIYNLDEPSPSKKKSQPFYGEIGAAAFGETLELGEDMDPESRTRDR